MLYLVHHGDAVGPEIDPMRPLSDLGRQHVDTIARQAAAHRVKPSLIWHSGKLRARQTAEAFWRRCNPLAECSAARGLQSADPPEWMRETLIEMGIEIGLSGEDRELLIVGHFPNLPRLLGLLLGCAPESAEADFPVHGLVALEHDGERWIEHWRIGEPGK